ncbi:MAG: TniQ family protein [Chloroflexota bacterium]
MSSLFYFDTLPVRPEPMPGESLSGYIPRILVANYNNTSMLSIQHSFQISGFRQPGYDIDVYQTFGNMPLIFGLSEETLRSMTIYHLASKFVLTISSNKTLSDFAKGCVSKNLRFCPACLQESQHYRLIWRFNLIDACATHQCKLLDKCTHCNKSIGFFHKNSPGTCPHCGSDLRECPTQTANTDNLDTVVQYQNELEFLLSPASWLETDQVVTDVGQILRYKRESKRMTLEDVAQFLSITPLAVQGMESRKSHRSGDTVNDYLRYFDLLDVSSIQLFDTAVTRPDQINAQFFTTAELTQKAQYAISEILRETGRVTIAGVCELMGISTQTLDNYPDVDRLIREVVEENKATRAAKLLEQVQTTAKQLEVAGVTRTAISLANHMNTTVSSLNYYPEVKKFIKEWTAESNPQTSRRKPTDYSNIDCKSITRKAIEVIKLMNQENQRITARAILQKMDLPNSIRKRCADLDEAMSQAIAEYKESYRKTLLTDVENAAREVEERGQKRSIAEIARMLGYTSQRLRHYEEVNHFLQAWIKGGN